MTFDFLDVPRGGGGLTDLGNFPKFYPFFSASLTLPGCRKHVYICLSSNVMVKQEYQNNYILIPHLIFVIFCTPLHYLGLLKVRQKVHKFATK